MNKRSYNVECLLKLLCLVTSVVSVMPNVRIPSQEERRLPRQCNSQKKGSLLLTRARAPAATNAVVQGQRALASDCYPNLQGVHKQLVAGLSGLVTCLQSNLIGPNLHGLFQTWAFVGFFSFPLIGSLLFARRMLIGWLQVA